MSTSLLGQIGPDGTGTVNGYSIGPEADLRGADLRGAGLSDADLRGADLSGANLRDANLSDANLRDANLSDANLSGALLSEANLPDANLSGANLSGANLEFANLRDANLSDADFVGAILSEAILSGANRSGADFDSNSDLAIWWSNVFSEWDYDAVVAERDAALAAQASAEAERDALPTQASYDAVVAELTTLEVRVFALLPKEQSSTAYEPVLLNAGTLGSNQDYTTVSDSGDGPREFNFEAQQGQLRWYSNGVELLNNSKIRISSADGQPFNLDSITFDQWETDAGYFSETIQASSEQEARTKAVQEYYNAYELSALTVSDDEGNLVYSFSTEFGPDDFEVTALANSASLLDAGTLGSNQDYTSVSDSGDGTRSFDFNALQGKLRWYSNGVELLDNSTIRISRGDGQPFNLDSITFDQWESESSFSEMIQADSEQEARAIAVARFILNAQGGLLIQNQNGETLYQVTPSVPNPGDFYVDEFFPGEYFVNYFGGFDSNLPQYRSVTIPSGDELDFVDITVEGFKIHVDSFNVSYDQDRYAATLGYLGSYGETPEGQTATSAQNVSYVDIETKGYKV
ncbi:MAG: pentapeptide repeat-containing protein, partial [Lentimonas sp.]